MPHPNNPAVAATAMTPEYDHTEACLGCSLLPEVEVRRMALVLKRCLPVLFKQVRERPKGLAALARRVADMQMSPLRFRGPVVTPIDAKWVPFRQIRFFWDAFYVRAE